MTESGDGALSAQDYETIFHAASDGLLVHPLDSDEILEVNDRLTEMFGYTREELLSLTVPDITADD